MSSRMGRLSAARVSIAGVGGTDDTPDTLVSRIGRVVELGAAGAAVGRAVWGDADPVAVANRIRHAVRGALDSRSSVVGLS